MIGLVNTLNYYPYCDIAIFIICVSLVCTISRVVVIEQNRTFSVFKAAIIFMIIATLSRVLSYYLYKTLLAEVPKEVYYILADLNEIAYFAQLALYIVYLYQLFDLRKASLIKVLNHVLLIIGSVFVVLEPVLKTGIYIDDDYIIWHRRGPEAFSFVYVTYIILIAFIIMSNRDRIIPVIQKCLNSTLSISLSVMLMEILINNETFTSITFLLPILVVLVMIHSNPYDISTGALSYQTLNDKIDIWKEKQSDFVLVNITFVNLTEEMSKDLKSQLFNFYVSYVNKANLFKVSNNRLILAFEIKDNPAYKGILPYITEILEMISKTYRLDYKITIVDNVNNIEGCSEYVDFIGYIENKCELNSVTYADKNSADKFHFSNIVLNEIQKIQTLKTLDVASIKVYCQPIYNIEKQQFRTGEALMRLVIPEIGMIMPDMFIKIAETHGIIHQLSLIILDKTCKQIHHLLNEGYEVDRISVNFSLIELREPTFFDDIKGIIEDNNIPFDKVAIELTESKDDKDFEMILDKVSKLRDLGIKIYLDDFGTGYSNMERIMKLPFDTIKFDRSLVLLSSEEDRYHYMVNSMAEMFSKLDYAVLFEGIETEDDEHMCKNMKAEYLQGYKYSKPVPIEEMTKFFTKTCSE